MEAALDFAIPLASATAASAAPEMSEVPPPTTKSSAGTFRHSGAGTRLPLRSFRIGMNPPPNCSTGVKVCTSPPTFLTSKASPSCVVARSGLKRHERTVCVADSSAMNSSKVVGPGFTQAVGSLSAALKLAGSQLSCPMMAPAWSGPLARLADAEADMRGASVGRERSEQPTTITAGSNITSPTTARG